MEQSTLNKAINKAIALVNDGEYQEALEYLDDVGSNLQFDIDDWMIETEEDEKHIETLRNALESIEEVQCQLESLLDVEDEGLEEEDFGEESDEEESDDEYADDEDEVSRIIQLLSAILTESE